MATVTVFCWHSLLNASFLVMFGYLRFSKNIKHCDAFWRLGRVKMIQSGHCVYDSKHYCCFDPVIHQVRVSQSSYEIKKIWEFSLKLETVGQNVTKSYSALELNYVSANILIYSLEVVFYLFPFVMLNVFISMTYDWEINHWPSAQSERCFNSLISLGMVRMYRKWKRMSTTTMAPRCTIARLLMFHNSHSLRVKSGLLACKRADHTVLTTVLKYTCTKHRAK